MRCRSYIQQSQWRLQQDQLLEIWIFFRSGGIRRGSESGFGGSKNVCCGEDYESDDEAIANAHA